MGRVVLSVAWMGEARGGMAEDVEWKIYWV